MPTYRITGPDGRNYQIDGPPGATKEQVIAAIQRRMGGGPAPAEKAGFFSSLADTAGTLLKAPQVGAFAAADEGSEKQAQLRKQVVENEQAGPAHVAFSDIHDVSSAWDWAKEMAGGSAGYLVAPGVAGFAAKMAGAPSLAAKAIGYGTLGAQYLVDNLVRQAQEQQRDVEQDKTPNPTSVGRAALSAAGQTALDVAQFDVMFAPLTKRFPGIGKLFGEEGEEAAQKTAKELGAAVERGEIKATNGMLKGALGGIAFEVPQEIAQQALERAQAGLSLTDDQARQEYLESAVGAALLGGPIGATQAYVQNASDLARGTQYNEAELLRKQAEHEAAREKAREEAQKQAEEEAARQQPPQGADAMDAMYNEAVEFIKTLPPETAANQWRKALRQKFNLTPGAGHDTALLDRLVKEGHIHKRNAWYGHGPGDAGGTGGTGTPPPAYNHVEMLRKAEEFLRQNYTGQSETTKNEWANALTAHLGLTGPYDKGRINGILKDLRNNGILSRKKGLHSFVDQTGTPPGGTNTPPPPPLPPVQDFATRHDETKQQFGEMLKAIPRSQLPAYQAQLDELNNIKDDTALDEFRARLQPEFDKYIEHTVDASDMRKEMTDRTKPIVERLRKDPALAAAVGDKYRALVGKVAPYDKYLFHPDEAIGYQQILNKDVSDLEDAVSAYDTQAENTKNEADILSFHNKWNQTVQKLKNKIAAAPNTDPIFAQHLDDLTAAIARRKDEGSGDYLIRLRSASPHLKEVEKDLTEWQKKNPPSGKPAVNKEEVEARKKAHKERIKELDKLYKQHLKDAAEFAEEEKKARKARDAAGMRRAKEAIRKAKDAADKAKAARAAEEARLAQVEQEYEATENESFKEAYKDRHAFSDNPAKGKSKEHAEVKDLFDRTLNPDGTNVAGLLDMIAIKAPTKFYRTLAKAIANRMRHIESVTNSRYVAKEHEAQGSIGSYNFFEMTLRFSSKYKAGVTPARYVTGYTYRTVLHEALHSITSNYIFQRYGLGDVISGSTNDPQIDNALDKLVQLYKHVDTIRRDEVHGLTNSGLFDADDMEFLKNPGNAFESPHEIITWGFTDPRMRKFLEKIPYQHTNAWSAFVNLVRNILGLAPQHNTALSAMMDITNTLMEAPDTVTEKLFLKNINRGGGSPSSTESSVSSATQPQPKPKPKTKIAEPYRDETHDERARRFGGQSAAKFQKPKGIMGLLSFIFSRKGYEYLVKKFQNDRRPLKTLQDLMVMAGKEIVTGENFNNLFDQITLSSGKAFNAMTEFLQTHMDNLDRSVAAYAKARGMEPKLALGYLQTYLNALHEGERRDVKYEFNVPLSSKKITKLDSTLVKGTPLEGVSASAADLRQMIIDELAKSHNLVKNGYAKKYRAALKELIYRKQKNGIGEFMDNTVDGRTTAKDINVVGMSLDKNDRVYDVIGAYTQKQIAEDYAAYQADPQKAKVDEIISHMKKLHDATVELDKQTNYWSQPVDNIKEFYGWKNYIPMKGQGEKATHASDDRFNFNGKRLGTGFNDLASEFSGRSTDSDNPVLQTMVDATKAALRYGRKDVVTALKNLIKQGYIKGRPKMVIPFADRYKADLGNEVKKENYFFHYLPDGTIEIYEVQDDEMREAIRRSYAPPQPFVQLANQITSGIGHLHTRWNLAFHPYNFVRDALTNAFTLGAEFGPGGAKRLLGAIAAKVGQSGAMTKAMKIARLYKDGKVGEIRVMAKSDVFTRDILEYLERGGRISYIQGMSVKTQQEELMLDVERGGFKRTKEKFSRWVDIWSDSFEFTSRAATYSVMKAEFRAKGMSEEAASIKAAAYAKNLANFEQVGEWGKAAGAVFMFFRPAATGAVRALDAILPAFQSGKSLIDSLPDSIKNDPVALEKVKKEHAARKKSAKTMMFTLAGAGATLYLMAMLASDDDDQGRNKIATDDMALWTRNIRLPLSITGNDKLKDDYLQIPWGFGLGAFGAMGAQVAGAAFGKSGMGDVMPNFVTIALDSYMPLPFERIDPTENFTAFVAGSVTPSAVRPFIEYAMNVDSLGREIYNNRMSKYGDAYTGGKNVPEAYRKAARDLFGITNGEFNVQPSTLYFWGNNYFDGVTRLGQGLFGLGMTLGGDKNFDLKNDVPLISSFVGRMSNYDGREFASVQKQIQEKESILKMLEGRPAQYQRYIEDHPNDPMVVEIYNQQANGLLKDLQAEKNMVNASDLNAKIREDYIRQNNILQGYIKRGLIDAFKQYGVEP